MEVGIVGLAEKKQIKALEDDIIPEIQSKLGNMIGKQVEVSVNWDSFETVAQLQEIQHQCLGRIVEGLQRIADDDMGKEALAESVESIKSNNIANAGDKKISLEGGVLTVDGKWEDFGSGIFTPGDYATQIEAAL